MAEIELEVVQDATNVTVTTGPESSVIETTSNSTLVTIEAFGVQGPQGIPGPTEWSKITGTENVATLSGTQTFSGAKTFNTITATGTITSTAGFSGPGGSITALNATNISTGTIADARLSTNVATLTGTQTFTGIKAFTGGLSMADTTLYLRGWADSNHAIKFAAGPSGPDGPRIYGYSGGELGYHPGTSFNAVLKWDNTGINVPIGAIKQGGISIDTLGDRVATNVRAGLNISGGGTLTVNGAFEIKWTTRFIVISNGRGAYYASSGYFDIQMPAAGTVITGVSGAGNQTVQAGGIPLPDWQALYYILPIGSTNASVPANFRIVGYTTDFEIPDHWVLLAVKNPENGGIIKFANGVTLLANTTSTAADPYQQYALVAGNQTLTGTKTFTSEIVGPASGNVLKVGDDARLVDVNVSNVLGVVSQTDVTRGGILFGTNTANFRIEGIGANGTITGNLTVTNGIVSNAGTSRLRRDEAAPSGGSNVIELRNDTGHPGIYFHRSGVSDMVLRLNTSNHTLEVVSTSGGAYANFRANTITAATFSGSGSGLTAIPGGNINAGSITNTALASLSVTPSKYNLPSLTNFAMDGEFRFPKPDFWNGASGTIVTSTTEPNYYEITSINGSNVDQANSYSFEVQSGERYLVEYEVYGVGTNATWNSVNVHIALRNYAGSTNSWPGIALGAGSLQAAPDTWIPVTGFITIPVGYRSGIVEMAVSSNGSSGSVYRFRNVRVVRQYANKHLEDLTITDAKIAAANKDGVAGTPSMRTLGTGAQQALAGTTRLDQIAVPTAAINLNSQRITNVADPTSAQDAVTKSYVDSFVQGLDAKPSVRAATTGNITLSGTQTIDGVALAVGNRVLVRAQTTGSENGLYTVATGAWPRSADADTSAEVTPGMYVFVEEGTTYADTGWVLSNDGAITLGTTALNFIQFSGAGQLNAGAGMTKTGNNFDVVGTANRIVANSDNIDIASTYVGQTSITTLGTITTGTWNGTAIPVANGGTGATTASAALTNLGASPVGHTHAIADITSLQTTLDAKFSVAGTGLTSSGGTVNVIGTTNRITANADSIDIASTYVGQTSITTLGTITAGTWNGTAIAVAYGGTGATTAAAALTNLGAVSTSDSRLSDARTPSNDADIVHKAGAETITGAKQWGGTNPILFTQIGAEPPTFNTRSPGTKMVWYPDVSASNVDFATGIAPSTLWNSIPQATSTYSFKWYTGTTEQMKLDGTGVLTVGGQAVVKTDDARLSDTRTPTAGSVVFTSLASSTVATSGTSSATALVRADDSRLSNARTPSGTAGGDLTGTYPNPTVAALAITDAKVAAANKDGIATTPSMRTLGTGAQQAVAGNDARLSDARTPLAHTHAIADVTSLQTTLDAKFSVAGTGLTSSGATVNVIGTTNRITANADSIDIASTYVGQTSITTVGTITTGTWNGTAIPVANGGTGSTTAAGARTALGAPGQFKLVLGALTAGAYLNITHNLNNDTPQVVFIDTLTLENLALDWKVVDVNTIAVRSDVNFAASGVRVGIVG